MRTSFQTRKDGSMVIDADAEAARVIFASVLFAARFHDTITPLVPVAQKALDAAGKDANDQRRTRQEDEGSGRVRTVAVARPAPGR